MTRARLRALGPGTRAALAVGALAGLGLATSVVSGARDTGPVVAGKPDPGRVVVDRAGRPVLGRDGRPLRVAPDGRTLLDSRGRPLRDRRGRPLALGKGRILPRAAERPRPRPRPRRPVRRQSEPRRRPSRRPAPSPAPARAPIRIGFAHLNAEAHNGLGGRFGIGTIVPDPAIAIRALVDHVNAEGGILGRPVAADVHEYNFADGRPFAVSAQEYCEHFSRTRPLAVIDRFGQPLLLTPCLAQAGVALVVGWPVPGNLELFARHPDTLFSPGGLAADRVGEPYVEGLRRAGFFGRGARVGLVKLRHPLLEPAGASIERALKASGAPPAATATIRPGDSAGAASLSDSLTQLGSAVVRFRSAGVTHVLLVDSGGGMTIGFMRVAAGQGYEPRYGLSSMSAANWTTTEAPRSQLRDSVGVGWAPLMDVAAEGEPPNPTRAECDRAFRRAGADIGTRSPFAQGGAYAYCDGLLAIRAALGRSRRPDAAGLREGLEGLGDAYQSAIALGTRLDGSRHDGAAAFRTFRFRAACACFRYD